MNTVNHSRTVLESKVAINNSINGKKNNQQDCSQLANIRFTMDHTCFRKLLFCMQFQINCTPLASCLCYIAASEDKQAPITAEEREAIKRQIEDEYRQQLYNKVSLLRNIKLKCLRII